MHEKHLPGQGLGDVSQLFFTRAIQRIDELPKPHMIPHSRFQSTILLALWVALLHPSSRVLTHTLTMSSHSSHSTTALARHYERQIEHAVPFITGPDRDIFLLRPLQDRSPIEHDDALRFLASSGVLSEYRYVDGSQPAILVVRAA